MSKLYILGNGFDKAHDLPTDYWDFRKYLEENHWKFLEWFEKIYNFYPLDISEPWYKETAQGQRENLVYDKLWKSFEEVIGTPDFQQMLDFSESVVSQLGLDGGNIGIQDTMDLYWKQEFGMVQKFSEYVTEWAEQIDVSSCCPRKDILKNNNTDYFLTFNYTNTLEKVYNIEPYNILHIHGGVKSCCGIPPIMGHGNTEDIRKYIEESKAAEEDFNEGEASIKYAISDYLNVLLKNTTQIIRHNEQYFEELNEVDEVIVLGTSYGAVDRPYLKKIRESVKPNTKWTLYWYSEKDKTSRDAAVEFAGIDKNNIIPCDSSESFWDYSKTGCSLR